MNPRRKIMRRNDHIAQYSWAIDRLPDYGWGHPGKRDGTDWGNAVMCRGGQKEEMGGGILTIQGKDERNSQV